MPSHGARPINSGWRPQRLASERLALPYAFSTIARLRRAPRRPIPGVYANTDIPIGILRRALQTLILEFRGELCAAAARAAVQACPCLERLRLTVHPDVEAPEQRVSWRAAKDVRAVYSAIASQRALTHLSLDLQVGARYIICITRCRPAFAPETASTAAMHPAD